MLVKAKIKPYEWLYFALLLCVAFTQLVNKALTESGGVTSRYGAFVIVLLLFVAFLGNRLSKPFLFRWLWLVCFWLFVCISVTALLFSIYMLSMSNTNSVFMSGLLLFIPLLITPGLWHLYLYVWVNKTVWNWAEAEEPVS